MRRAHSPSHGMIDHANPVDWNHPEAQGLVGHWICLPGIASGAQWRDVCGRNPGTLTNMATNSATSGWGATTRPGGVGGMRFDGVNDYAHIKNTSVMRVLNNATLSFFFYPTIIDGNDRWPYSENDSGGIVYGPRINANKLGFYIKSSSGTNNALVGNITLIANTHYHAVCVVDQSAKVITTYLNGIFDNNFLTWDGTFFNTIVEVNIGRITNSGGIQYFQGSLDDIRIYNRALSATEVQQVYLNSQKSLPPHLRRLASIFCSIPPAAGGGPLYASGPLIDGPLSSGRLVA